MVVGDSQYESPELRPVEPGVDERLVDFDQLDHDQQRAFLRLHRGERADPELAHGVVIRYTDYYRLDGG